MTWLWILLGVIAVLILVPQIVGRFLPETYRAAVRLRFDRPPDEIWAAMQDYRKHPLCGPMAKSVSPLEDGAWIEDMRSSRVTVREVESEPPRRLVRALQDDVVPMTARWECVFEPAGEEGTEIVAVNEITVRSGTWHVPLFRFMLAVSRAARKGLLVYFRGIADDLGADVVRLEDPSIPNRS